MKKFVLTIIAVVAMATPALAQIGDISTYSDQPGTSCNIVDTLPFPNFIDTYIIHKHSSGATASQFALSTSGGSTLSQFQLNAGPGMLTIGDATDYSVSYGVPCAVGDIYIANVRYFGSGTSAACAKLLIVAAPTSPIPGEVAAVTCAFVAVVIPTGQAIINPNGSCQCDVAVNETTWGAIKALYR